MYHNKEYLGFYDKFDAALKAKADAMGTQPKILKMKYENGSWKEEPSKHKGVTKIYRDGNEYWQAQSGKSYLGCSKSLSSAAAMVKAHEGESPKEKPRRDWFSQ